MDQDDVEVFQMTFQWLMALNGVECTPMSVHICPPTNKQGLYSLATDEDQVGEYDALKIAILRHYDK